MIKYFLNQERMAEGPVRLVSLSCFGSHIGMRVCPPPRELITSDVIWCDIGRVQLVIQVLWLSPAFNYFI